MKNYMSDFKEVILKVRSKQKVVVKTRLQEMKYYRPTQILTPHKLRCQDGVSSLQGYEPFR